MREAIDDGRFCSSLLPASIGTWRMRYGRDRCACDVIDHDILYSHRLLALTGTWFYGFSILDYRREVRQICEVA